MIIETANKIINKQDKSVMLDFFTSCSDLCQLTVATSRHRTLSSSQDRTTQIHKEIFTVTL